MNILVQVFCGICSEIVSAVFLFFFFFFFDS